MGNNGDGICAYNYLLTHKPVGWLWIKSAVIEFATNTTIFHNWNNFACEVATLKY